MNMNFDDFSKMLSTCDNSYTSNEKKELWQEISKASDEIRDAIFKYMETQTEKDFSENVWNICKLKQKFGMNYIAAALTIDWIRKNPKEALPALQKGIL